jgi:glutamate synthase (NADPH/NADH) small chain
VDLKNTIERTKVTHSNKERVSNYNEFTIPLAKENKRTRIKLWIVNPVLYSACPLNLIPDFNDMVHQEEWQGTLEIYNQQITFKFTGQHALPCEKSCVLGIIEECSDRKY